MCGNRELPLSIYAVTSEVEVALLALLEEDVPVLNLNGHFNADCGEVLLHGLSNGNMPGVRQ